MQHALSFRRGPFIRICWARRVRPALRRAKRAFDPLNLHFHFVRQTRPGARVAVRLRVLLRPRSLLLSFLRFVRLLDDKSRHGFDRGKLCIIISRGVAFALNRLNRRRRLRRRRRLGRAHDAGRRVQNAMDEEKQERDDTPPREGEFRGAERNGHRRENDVVVDFFLEHFWKRNPTLIDKNDKNDKNDKKMIKR